MSTNFSKEESILIYTLGFDKTNNDTYSLSLPTGATVEIYNNILSYYKTSADLLPYSRDIFNTKNLLYYLEEDKILQDDYDY